VHPDFRGPHRLSIHEGSFYFAEFHANVLLPDGFSDIFFPYRCTERGPIQPHVGPDGPNQLADRVALRGAVCIAHSCPDDVQSYICAHELSADQSALERAHASHFFLAHFPNPHTLANLRVTPFG
jgi:hypothetical protein